MEFLTCWLHRLAWYAGLCSLFDLLRRFFSHIHFSCSRFCTWIGMTIMEGNLHRLISFRSSLCWLVPSFKPIPVFLCYSSIISCIYCISLICSFGNGSGEMTSHLPIWVLVGTTTWTWFQRSSFPHLVMVFQVLAHFVNWYARHFYFLMNLFSHCFTFFLFTILNFILILNFLCG